MLPLHVLRDGISDSVVMLEDHGLWFVGHAVGLGSVKEALVELSLKAGFCLDVH